MQTSFQNSASCGQKPFVFRDDKPIPDIRYDNVFKAVFTRDNAESKGALSSLISALIEKPVSVETILANEPPVDNTGQRNIRFDISCKTQSGELVNIEMSFYPKAGELERFEYYEAKLFSGQDIKGADKSYSDLKKAYQIAILAKEIIFPDDALTRYFEYYDPVNKVSLNGKTRIIIMELAKAAKIIEKSAAEMSTAEAWAAFFEYLTDRKKSEKITEIVNHEGGIAMAANALYDFSENEKEYFRQMSELKYELDHQSDMVNAERQGIQQGLQRGIQQGRLEADLEYARKMKEDNLPVSQISKYTGLSAQQIQDI
ncbi:MAG: Rpn family recombination-promoting nuclease/putative transposase [Treponema sp.]|jgi:predicted transposase/invertase (TIGR01784 family)|nr:Rpn family recombination-promoting nuclease/putative transposase [Treponema sp.]